MWAWRVGKKKQLLAMRSSICYSQLVEKYSDRLWVGGWSGQLSPTRSFRDPDSFQLVAHYVSSAALLPVVQPGHCSILLPAHQKRMRRSMEGKRFPLRKWDTDCPYHFHASSILKSESCDYPKLQRKLGKLDPSQEASDQDRKEIWVPTSGYHRY